MFMKRFGIAIAVMLLVLAAFFHPLVSEGILAAGERCVTVLVPSLYLYSIIAAFVTHSGLLGSTGKASVLTAVILSQLGGYPLGAQLICGMVRSGSITEAQAKRMLCVCIGCGPGFLLGTVCGRLPVGARLWMMASVTLPQLLAGLLLLRGIRPERCSMAQLRGTKLLTGSVEAAADAMLRICSMVLAMAGVMAVMEGLGLFRLTCAVHLAAPAFLRTVLEVSCITDFLAQGGSLPMAAALLTFGGLCVHLQIASLCDGLLPWLRFWGIRLLCSVAAYGLCSLGMPYLCREVQTASLLLTPEPAAHEAGLLPGICLLLMSVLVLYRSEQVCVKRKKSPAGT